MITLLTYLIILLQPTVMGATHYGPSYHGRQMACTRGDTYDTNDPTIAAVGPSYRYGAWPCGTTLLVEGPNASQLVVVRDYCPGCDNYWPNKIDLSEAGVSVVCGGIHSCTVQVTRSE